MRELDRTTHPEGLTQSGEAFALAIFDSGVLKFGGFRLKLHEQYPEAPLSPIYFDFRLLRRILEVKQMAVQAFYELSQGLWFELLADIPTAVTPIISSLSDRLNVGMITPRSDGKVHGTGAQVDGLLPEDIGRTALLFDDVVTHAESKLRAAEILRNQGIQVTDVLVLVDREQGGVQELLAHDLRLHSAFSLTQMLDLYVRLRKIDLRQRKRIGLTLETIQELVTRGAEA